MTAPAPIRLSEPDIDALATAEGTVAVLVGTEGEMDTMARRANKLSRGAVERATAAEAWQKADEGEVVSLSWPSGMAAERLLVVKLGRKAEADLARKTGVAIAQASAKGGLTLCLGRVKHAREVVLGAMLRRYDYTDQKSKPDGKPAGEIMAMIAKPDDVDATDLTALAEGVFFCRDLVNDPANVLTTTTYAERLQALSEHGLEVEVLEEDKLRELGMGALLAVGQGSDSPSKVVVMKWMGGGDEAPLALVGKGVVFDTGGISLKPGAGMEDMTMDMGGSAVVAGVMKTLAMRKAKANVVGLVGLVENMPSGRAYRPGDVVTSMKGDTIEVINTDAEGRLVLADVMWYAQETFEPSGLIDLATLTGAVIIGLGHHNAGLLSNDDGFVNGILKAAGTEGEGAWRLPLGKEYADQLKSRIADVKNVGGRPAGTITAAEFLHRFVKEGTRWCHIDIAGVASTSFDSPYAPKGASGWGVRALDRFIRDTCEA
ncbi:leucyl aminopeptidase [Palleronia marisminoris]|uniref:Probable cytosol aminopeptidase n=1 Tax=Palleronia marisminoris TaxID=315423 RepID=A0A1Y5TAZ8_9RHOB|nr:leucyl aminopeptidase [Palleronia marisminoris]SFH22335.1 leucyl aminopeptidase [Palleronia marisminoris]SLN57815.1 Cytosol aminopeptidase [Palleronia marisminoris]